MNLHSVIIFLCMSTKHQVTQENLLYCPEAGGNRTYSLRGHLGSKPHGTLVPQVLRVYTFIHSGRNLLDVWQFNEIALGC